jgi:hypothetical protein
VEKESDPKTWIAREAVQTPPRNSDERRVENKIVNSEKDALRSDAHHWLILLASVFLVGAPVCRPWWKRAATVAVALPLRITLDIAAVPPPRSSCSRRVRTSQDGFRSALSSRETFLPRNRVMFEYMRVHNEAAGSLVCVLQLKHQCFVRSLVYVLSQGRRDLPWSKSVEDVDQKRGSRKRSEERTDLVGAEIAAEDDNQHDKQAKE